jgi:hypothetical protein
MPVVLWPDVSGVAGAPDVSVGFGLVVPPALPTQAYVRYTGWAAAKLPNVCTFLMAGHLPYLWGLAITTPWEHHTPDLDHCP